MIKSWKTSATRQLAETGKSKFSGLDVEKAMLRLRSLDDLVALSEIDRLKGTGLHKLTGGRKGQWAVNINGPWRLVFEFKNGNAYNVEIVDYH